MKSMNVRSSANGAAGKPSASIQRAKGMYASQRALELRKFYDPYQADINPHSPEDTLNGRLNSDGALDSFAEVAIWRLGGVHSMISIIDGSTQYFIAGARRDKSSPEDDIVNDSWFGCFQVPSQGGLCENTLAIDNDNDDEDPYRCFIIDDLKKDPRFERLPIVDGSVASYVWYAGAPITTKNGINIGVLCVFGDRPITGLSLERRKFLYRQASNIMKYIDTQREATERHRVALMSKGIATFLERASRYTTISDDPYASEELAADRNNVPNSVTDSGVRREEGRSERSNTSNEQQQSSEFVLDQIRITLDHAAEILRESLELEVGGVVFLDTAAGYTEAGNIDAYLDTSTDLGTEVKEVESRRSSIQNEERRKYDDYRRRLSQGALRTSTDKHKPAKILSMSTAKVATWDSDAHVLDGKTLQSLISSYPKGNIWYIDNNGYFSSLEQVNDRKHASSNGTKLRPRTSGSFDATKRDAEANMLAKVFHKARQIIFLPLWDSAGERWYSASFVWSQSPVPVFTVNNEISYLSAFTNSVMVEISRLDALISNKMKSDFISSISHEFRSPLHAIMASTDFLRESNLDTSQTEFVSTIQNCSGTLLDTINHVLDYSKINSFQKKEGSLQGSFSSELHRVTNVALLCEDTINGMIAANHFRSVAPTYSLALSNGSPSNKDGISYSGATAPLQIILDFEMRDWNYKVHAGAIQRILMNVFGNSQKYTDGGFIQVQLHLQNQNPSLDVAASGSNHTGDFMCLRIKDSGRGMSAEYMERKLYHPFAQENSFTPGVGLGLSIVWGIVKQLGGTILISSEVGIGTDVEVLIPVEKSEPHSSDDLMSGDTADTTDLRVSAEKAIRSLRNRATGKVISIDRGQLTFPQNNAWDCIQKYCSEWYRFEILKPNGNAKPEDLHIVNETSSSPESYPCQRVLVVHDAMSYPSIKKQDSEQFIGHISQPIGPYRLARSILALLDQTSCEPLHKDATTQTPLATPDERFGGGGEYSFLPVQEPEPNTINEVTFTLADQNPREEFDQSPKRLEQLQFPVPPTTLTQHQTIVTSRTSDRTSSIPTQPSPPPPLAPQAKPAPDETPLHILAVDDNALNLQLIHRYLQKRKIDTIVDAADGSEALAAVKASAHGFDVIFMDISMPKMDGFEATRLIRGWEVERTQYIGLGELVKWVENGRGKEKEEEKEKDELDGIGGMGGERAYIVAMTGLGSQKARDEADRSGFDDFITKPVKLPKVGELLKRLSCEKAARLEGARSNRA